MVVKSCTFIYTVRVCISRISKNISTPSVYCSFINYFCSKLKNKSRITFINLKNDIISIDPYSPKDGNIFF